MLFALLLATAPPPTVAVLYFDYSGKDEALAVLKKGFAQILISDLSTLEAVRLVERERLEAVLAEHKLAGSSTIDSATAAKLGKLLGARYLVLGAYFELGGALRVDARVVEVETSRILSSTGATGTPGEFMDVERKIADGVGHALATSLQVKDAAAQRMPLRLKTKTAVRYSKALDAADHGNKVVAQQELQAVIAEQPEFKLAASDLKRMMQ